MLIVESLESVRECLKLNFCPPSSRPRISSLPPYSQTPIWECQCHRNSISHSKHSPQSAAQARSLGLRRLDTACPEPVERALRHAELDPRRQAPSSSSSLHMSETR